MKSFKSTAWMLPQPVLRRKAIEMSPPDDAYQLKKGVLTVRIPAKSIVVLTLR